MIFSFYLFLESSTTDSVSSSSSQQSVDSGWNSLGLTYIVDWPLHILFTPSVLEK
jgi:hypothetical protein